MSVYSRKVKSSFENLQLNQVDVLLNTLRILQRRNAADVKRKFLEKAQNFDSTLQFLIAIKAVDVSGDELSLRDDWGHPETAQNKKIILDSLLKYNTSYRKEISEFLSNFKVLDERIVYPSNPLKKSYEQFVRNFLMELDVLTYESSEDRYSLEVDHIDFYATSQDHMSSMDVSDLKNVLRLQEEVGFSAESEIISYEKKRLGDILAHKVIQVSRDNTAAGYDIRSVSLDENGRQVPRFIEVKAVPCPSFRFYWSANEIAAANKFKELYYLYLLPVKKYDTFDIENLRIIQNPSEIIMNSTQEWVKEPDGMKCYLKN